MNTGQDGANHYELTESSFTNTYDCVASDVYSEVGDQAIATHKLDTQVYNIFNLTKLS